MTTFCLLLLLLLRLLAYSQQPRGTVFVSFGIALKRRLEPAIMVEYDIPMQRTLVHTGELCGHDVAARVRRDQPRVRSDEARLPADLPPPTGRSRDGHRGELSGDNEDRRRGERPEKISAPEVEKLRREMDDRAVAPRAAEDKNE